MNLNFFNEALHRISSDGDSLREFLSRNPVFVLPVLFFFLITAILFSPVPKHKTKPEKYPVQKKPKKTSSIVKPGTPVIPKQCYECPIAQIVSNYCLKFWNNSYSGSTPYIPPCFFEPDVNAKIKKAIMQFLPGELKREENKPGDNEYDEFRRAFPDLFAETASKSERVNKLLDLLLKKKLNNMKESLAK